MDFTNERVLVTGGSRGIGFAIAQAFARAGAFVAIASRNAPGNVIDELPGGPHCAIEMDVSNPQEARAAVDQTASELGGLDILVNNAGTAPPHHPLEVNYDEWQAAWSSTLGTNLTGASNVSYCAAQHMAASGGGRIVMVSSRGAFRGEPGRPAYGASKAGLNALAQSLAQALAPHGVFVSAVAPGYVETELSRDDLTGARGEAIRAQSPLGRIARPEEVAHAVLFLASKGAELSTGTIIDVNGASYLRS